jgi:hypothetical protein
VADSTILVGEVHTALLQHSRPATPDEAAQLVDFVLGERVRRVRRPVPAVRSPEILTGVDCWMPTSNRARVRAVGTTVSRAAITGGMVAQGTSYATVELAAAPRRLPWSHYLTRRGVIETMGNADAAMVAEGLLHAGREPDFLDLQAISERALDRVQHNGELDHQPAFKAQRGQLRFVVVDPPHDALLVGDSDTSRRIRLPKLAPSAAMVEFCEDLALHDWLLTTVELAVERSAIGTAPRAQVVARLAPVLEQLGHLWMPTARTDPDLDELWRLLEHRPGLTGPWTTTLNRIRDQVTLAATQPALVAAE